MSLRHALLNRLPDDLESRGIRQRIADRAAGSVALSTYRNSERYCRELTRREASNFYWGFVALPRAQRTAIYALYSFARQIDDVVDRAGESGPERNCFERERERLRRGLAGDSLDPVLHVLASVVDRYAIPYEELEALIRGVEQDLHVRSYESWDDLRAYCLLVASTVGRMCVRIFGYTDRSALRYADDLGVAMQLANVLRDIREDYHLGRIYLPREDLQQFGVEESVLGGAGCQGWEDLVAFEAARARDHFQSGLRVVELIPRRAAVCVLTMAGIYQAILSEIERDPCLPLRERISLGGRAKASVMARSWLQAM